MTLPTPISSRLVIAITGAQGVGKSTLASGLEREFSRLTIGPCTAHQNLGQTASSKGVPLRQHANHLTIMEFARLHSRRERQLFSGIHLLDRCFVDVLAYARTVCAEQTILIQLIEELTRASLAGVSLVVRVPMIPCLAESRSANESTQFRTQIDQVIQRILPDMQVNYLEVGSTTPEERVYEVICFLRGKKLL